VACALTLEVLCTLHPSLWIAMDSILPGVLLRAW
jgi:hypothetical protein